MRLGLGLGLTRNMNPSAVSLPDPNTDLSAYAVEIDFDFRDGKSLSGTDIYNMAGSPDSGAARTAYTFTNNGASSTDGYLTFGGTDYLSQKAASNTDFIKGLHKSNNTQGFTLCVVSYVLNASTTSRMFFETRSGVFDAPGLALYLAGSEETKSLQYGDTGIGNVGTGGTVPNATPSFICYAWDKANEDITFGVNGSYVTDTTNALNATTTDPAGVPWISGSDFSANNYLETGERIYQWVLFRQELTTAEMDAVQGIIETRTGLTF